MEGKMSLPLRLRTLLLLLSMCHPTWAASATASDADGQRLFINNCAACHGNDGQGGVGVPLALPSFLSAVDDDYLRKTIRNGRVGRIMPAFKRFSDAEVDAVVAHIRSLSKAPQAKLSGDRIVGDRRNGQQLFARHCAACHGESGAGGHGTGVTLSRPRNLPILAPGLNNPGFLASAKDSMIKQTLMLGRAGTPMVSFAKKGLSEKQINDIVVYVRSYEDHSPPAAATLLDTGTAVILRESPYSVEQTVEKVKTAISGVNMRLIRVMPLDQGYVREDAESKQAIILYACDFAFLNKALAVDPRVGLFLPCRITVLQTKGKVLVMSVNPKRLSAIFNNAELNRLCEEMTRIYTDIIEEATL
jgi:cytochrome c oxidase cbb3-type subunit III